MIIVAGAADDCIGSVEFHARFARAMKEGKALAGVRKRSNHAGFRVRDHRVPPFTSKIGVIASRKAAAVSDSARVCM